MYPYCNPGVTCYQSERRTIVLEWMASSRSCLHSEVTGRRHSSRAFGETMRAVLMMGFCALLSGCVEPSPTYH